MKNSTEDLCKQNHKLKGECRGFLGSLIGILEKEYIEKQGKRHTRASTNTTPETYDFLSERGAKTFFNHLLLGSEDIRKLTDTNVDASNLQVVLTINGVQVRVSDFNEVLSDWSDRVAEQALIDAADTKVGEKNIEELKSSVFWADVDIFDSCDDISYVYEKLLEAGLEPYTKLSYAHMKTGVAGFYVFEGNFYIHRSPMELENIPFVDQSDLADLVSGKVALNVG